MDFVAGAVHIPNDYQPIDLNEFIDVILASELPEDQKEYRVSRLAALEVYGNNLALYVREDSIFDNIMIVGGSGMEFKPNNARFYLNCMEEPAKSSWNRIRETGTEIHQRIGYWSSHVALLIQDRWS